MDNDLHFTPHTGRVRCGSQARSRISYEQMVPLLMFRRNENYCYFEVK